MTLPKIICLMAFTGGMALVCLSAHPGYGVAIITIGVAFYVFADFFGPRDRQ